MTGSFFSYLLHYAAARYIYDELFEHGHISESLIFLGAIVILLAIAARLAVWAFVGWYTGAWTHEERRAYQWQRGRERGREKGRRFRKRRP